MIHKIYREHSITGIFLFTHFKSLGMHIFISSQAIAGLSIDWNHEYYSEKSTYIFLQDDSNRMLSSIHDDRN